MKRSQAISLLMLCGAGVLAYGFAQRDESQQESEEAFLFPSVEACNQTSLPVPVHCATAAEEARLDAERTAPRYVAQADCEQNHGANCSTLSEGGATYYRPSVSGFLIGHALGRAAPVQPLYRVVNPASGSIPQPVYSTGSGHRLQPAWNGAVRLGVPAAALLERPSAPRVIGPGAPAFRAPATVARGGFGATGRSFSSYGAGG